MAGDDFRLAYMLGLVGAGKNDDDDDWCPEEGFELRGDFWNKMVNRKA